MNARMRTAARSFGAWAMSRNSVMYGCQAMATPARKSRLAKTLNTIALMDGNGRASQRMTATRTFFNSWSSVASTGRKQPGGEIRWVDLVSLRKGHWRCVASANVRNLRRGSR